MLPATLPLRGTAAMGYVLYEFIYAFHVQLVPQMHYN